MLDKIEISLEPKYSAEPPFVSVKIDGDIIYEGPLDSNKGLVHNAELSESFSIEIDKRGKTKSLAKAGENQEVKISSLLLNGLSVHPDKFGKFYQNGNNFVGEKIIDGDTMALNGVWKLDLPILRQPFLPDLENKFRHSFANTGIACFGCSVTYGTCLELGQTWPSLLSADAENYGFAGSSISSIIGTARAYIANHTCEKMVILLPHPCRLQLKDTDGSILTLMPGRTPEVEKKFKQITRDIVMFGEASLLLSGYANALKVILRDMSRKTKIFISAYEQGTYECFRAFEDKSFTILPFYEMSEEYDMASDGEHPGPEHNRIFADKIRPIVGG